MDLLVTDVYTDNQEKDPVTFFRGVQTDKGLRFEKGISLFTAQDANKTFPGCQPNITVTDYNHDGISDLVIGISLPTVNGFEIDSLVAWDYISDLGIETPGKDIGELTETKAGLEKILARIKAEPEYRSLYLASSKLKDDKYLTLLHRGYVYVMLGKRNPVKSNPIKGVVAKEEVRLERAKPKEVSKETKDATEKQLKNIRSGGNNGPVSFELEAPFVVRPSKESEISVTLNFKDNWHGYTDSKTNETLGMIPTKVEYQMPQGLELVGSPINPSPQVHGGYEVYQGAGVKFIQKFKVNEKVETSLNQEFIIKVTISYQVCNEAMCLPPATENAEIKVIFFKGKTD